jgi:hypothetical protein
VKLRQRQRLGQSTAVTAVSAVDSALIESVSADGANGLALAVVSDKEHEQEQEEVEDQEEQDEAQEAIAYLLAIDKAVNLFQSSAEADADAAMTALTANKANVSVARAWFMRGCEMLVRLLLFVRLQFLHCHQNISAAATCACKTVNGRHITRALVFSSLSVMFDHHVCFPHLALT